MSVEDKGPAGRDLGEQWAYLGVLALKWHDLRDAAIAAREVRSSIRDELGSCEGLVAGGQRCFQEDTPGFSKADWCPSCLKAEPATFAYWKAARRAGRALATFRKAAKQYRAPQAAGPVSASLEGSNPSQPPTQGDDRRAGLEGREG